MIHPWAVIVKVRGQVADLFQVDACGGGDGVYAQPGIAFLQLGQGLVGFHRLLKGALRFAEFVVKGRHAVERNLGDEQTQFFFLERALDLLHRAIGEVRVGGHVDLAHSVVTDKLPANLRELLPEKRLSAR